MKKYLKNLAISVLFFIGATSHAFTIVLDPGHGGEDKGAKSKFKHGLYEKDLTLAIAKRIKSQLEKKYSVFLTRSLDRTLTLNERAKLTDKLKADIFISIHVNSGNNKYSRGFETYYLDNHNDAGVKKVESVENQFIDKSNADDIIVNQILADLVVSRVAPQSKQLSLIVHKKISRVLRGRFKMKDRGVRPGLFYVLALTKRPAILLEAGFMSNKLEQKILRSKKFQISYAKAVAAGINEYVDHYHPVENIPLF